MENKHDTVQRLILMMILMLIFALVGVVSALWITDYVDIQETINNQLQNNYERQQVSISQLVKVNDEQINIIADLTLKIQELESDKYGYGSKVDMLIQEYKVLREIAMQEHNLKLEEMGDNK